jgi:uncharacterized sulfatase
MHTFENATLLIDDPAVSIPPETDLLDVAPTILDLMDVEYDRSAFDGASLLAQ